MYRRGTVNKSRRAIAYIRSHSNHESQILDVVSYCIKNRIHLVHLFTDIRKGTDDFYPGLIELSNYIHKKQNDINYLIVAHINRISLKAVNVINFLKKLPPDIVLIDLSNNDYPFVSYQKLAKFDRRK